MPYRYLYEMGPRGHLACCLAQCAGQMVYAYALVAFHVALCLGRAFLSLHALACWLYIPFLFRLISTRYTVYIYANAACGSWGLPPVILL